MKNMINSFVLLLVGMMGVDRHALRADVLQPIVSRAGANRICVELCSGALGGAGCGDFCLDLVPDGLPVQYGQDSYSEGSSSGDVNDTTSSSKHGVRSSPRESVCGVLCENNLGYPLCQCEIKGIVKKRDRPNFLEVCAVYCNAYNYQLHGCQECGLYKIPMKQHSSRKLLSDDVSEDYQPKYDWSGWCTRQCSHDDGGAACNCDMLPMMTAI